MSQFTRISYSKLQMVFVSLSLSLSLSLCQVLVILFFKKLCYISEHREDQNFAMLYSNVLILHEITRIITT